MMVCPKHFIRALHSGTVWVNESNPFVVSGAAISKDGLV